MRRPFIHRCSSEAARLGRGLACLGLLLLGGCRPLPDVGTLIATAANSGRLPPLIEAGGAVSPAQRAERLAPLMFAGGDANMLARHLPVAAAISPAPLVDGNHVTLLQDGPDIEHAILDAVASARNHVNVETYILADDEVGRRFADALVRKRAEHVPVTLMYDSFASRGTPRAFFERLRRAGVRVLQFNPIDPFAARIVWRPNHRDHRKVFIADGSVAIIGGANVEHPHAVDQETYWRDTDIRLEGPVVAQLQALFMQTWHEQGGGALAQADYFPAVPAAGDQIVRVLGSTSRTSPIYSTLVSAISASKRSVYLTTPYFAPDAQLLAAIESASARGVDVKLMLPSFSDFPPALAAARYRYQELMDAGVEIHERQHAWLHAKTAVIDGVWATVGSMNLDRRSFLFNQEVNAIMPGRAFAAQMERSFMRDVAAARRIRPETWRQRSTAERIAEWAANLLSYWW
jgi:cardiolipin synthase A/B